MPKIGMAEIFPWVITTPFRTLDTPTGYESCGGRFEGDDLGFETEILGILGEVSPYSFTRIYGPTPTVRRRTRRGI